MLIIIIIGLVLINYYVEKLFVKLNIASVLAPLFLGLIVGPIILDLVQATDFVHFISEIGVLILMFLAGLETNLKKMFKIFKPAFTLAVVCVVFPIIAYTGLCYFIGLEFGLSFFIGIIFAATSISVPIQLFKQKKKIDTDYGRLILGAAVFDDIIVMILLSITLSFLTQGEGSSGLLFLVASLVVVKVVFFSFIYAMHKFLIPNFVNKVKIDSNLKMLILAISLCLIFANIAEASKISGIIGAFFAGLALSDYHFRDKLNHNLEVIGNSFFIPVFFISIGLGLSSEGLSKNHLLLLLFFCILSIITKFIGGYYMSRKFGMDKRKSKIVGYAMMSRGEVALIISQLGVEEEIIQPQLYTVVVFTIIFTTIISPIALSLNLDKKSVVKL